MMFGRRKRQNISPYDKTGKIPVIRSSICTGEQVAGFKDIVSEKFEELMLIRSEKNLAEFLSQYQVKKARSNGSGECHVPPSAVLRRFQYLWLRSPFLSGRAVPGIRPLDGPAEGIWVGRYQQRRKWPLYPMRRW